MYNMHIASQAWGLKLTETRDISHGLVSCCFLAVLETGGPMWMIWGFQAGDLAHPRSGLGAED